MRSIAAPHQKNMLNVSLFDGFNDFLRMRQHGAMCKSGRQSMTAIDSTHAAVMLIATQFQ